MNKTFFTKLKWLPTVVLTVFSFSANAQLVDTTVPEFHWAKQWSSYFGVEKIAADRSGNIYCAAIFGYASDFDPGPGEFIMTPGMEGQAGNAYISKFDANGNFLWAKKIEPDPNTPAVWDMYNVMQIQSIAVSPTHGNVYLAGSFVGAMDLDPGPDVFTVSPENDIDAWGEWWPSNFIVKLSAAGEFLWGAKIDNYNGNTMNLAVREHDGNEDLYFTGDYDQLSDPATDWTTTLLIDYDPGPEEYLVGGEEIHYRDGYGYLMKWSGDGEFQWFKRIARAEGAGLSTYGVSTPSIDNDGNIFIAGHFYGIMDVDPSNETYLVSSVDTLPSEATTSGVARELYVAKYDPVGELVWFRYSDAQPMVDVGMYYYPEVWNASVGIDINSNVYVAPIFRGNINLDREIPVGGDASFETYFNPFPQMGVYLPNYPASAIMKYNSNGDFQWAKLLDNSANSGVEAGKIAVSPNGEVYIRGTYRSSIDFDPGVDTHFLSGTTIDGQLTSLPYQFLAKYDSNGNYLWAGRINTPVPMSDSVTAEHVNDMILDYQNNIIYGGTLYDTSGIDVDPTEEVFLLQRLNIDMADGYLVKLRLETTYADTTDTSTSVNNLAEGVDLKVFPNPNRGQLQIKSSKVIINGIIQILDITSKTVYEKNNLNGTDFVCDLGGLPNGNYLLRITEGNRAASFKLVKQE